MVLFSDRSQNESRSFLIVLFHETEVLKHTECLEGSKSGLDDCSDIAVNDTLRVSLSQEKHWLPGSCCFLGKAKECTLRVINSKCKGDSIEYMIKSLNAFHGDAFDLACGNNYVYGSPKCNEIIREIAKLPKDIKKVPRTFVPVTLQLMSKLLA